MRIISFNFTKSSVEKLSDAFKDLKINTNIHVSEIKGVKQDIFKSKEEFLGINFEFNIDYAPEIAKIEFKGKVLIGVEQKKAKDILKQWEEKKIEEGLKLLIFNVILRKSNIKALQLEDEMNLPPHINLPSVRKQEDSKEDNN